MENLSHSRQPNRANGASKVARKAYNNGGGFGSRAMFDDVYGGPPKFGASATLSPRSEDYSEIFESFHVSRASSIPVLDLPAVDDSEVFFDVRSSGFDYTEVFGGFDGLDCALSYEDLLFDQSKDGDRDSSEEEEAWTPAGSGSPSEESDHYEKNHCLSNGECYQSFDDGNTDFSISYHKANQTSDEYMSCETTHISELHAVSGFTFGFKESSPLQNTEDENPFLQVTDDDNLSMDFSVGMIKGKHLKKTMSHPSNGIAGGQTFGNDLKPEKGYCRSGSLPNGTFLTVSDISLRTQPSELPPPSRPPPLADVKMEDSISLTSNGKCIDSEGTAGDSSLPIFDVEVDASSSAAASAAAMKEAMKKAQAKLRSAKELMDRKKEGFHGSAKMSSKNHVLDREEKESKIVDECAILRDDSEQSAHHREGNREERQKVRKKAQEVPDSIEEEKLLKVTKKSAEKKLGQESWSSLRSDKIDGDSEWKEASQFFELVRTDESGKALQQTNHVQISVHNTQMHERGRKETKATLGVFGQKEEDSKNVKSARGNHELEYEKRSKVAKEACEQEENNGRSKTVKEAHRQKEHEKVKVAREVFEQVENEKKVRVAQKRLETEKKSTGADVSENCDNLAEFQRKENKFEVEQAMKHKENQLKLKEANKRMEGEKRHKESCEREDNEKRKIEGFKQEENEKKLKEALGRVEDEKKLKEALEQKESEKRLKEEVIERDENEKKQKEACKRQEDEKELREDLEQEENKKQLQKVLEQEEREKRLKETLEWEEDEKKQKEFHEREENEKRLEQALEREENEKKQQDAYERNENEKRLNVACEIEEEKSLYGASEQEDGRENLKRAHERKEHDGRSKEGFEQEETEKTAKEASIWEETEKRLKDAGGKEELKGLNKLHGQTGRDKTGKKLKLAKQTFLRVEGEDLRVSDGALEREDSENLQAPNLTCTNDKNSENMEKTEDALAHEENGTTKSEPKDKEKDPEAVEIANVLVGEKCKASDVAQGDLGLEENRFGMEDDKKSLPLDENVKKAGAPSIGVGQTQTYRSKSLSQLDSDPIIQERKFAHEWGERGNNMKQTQAVLDQEESKDRLMSTHVKKDWVESGRKIEAACPAMPEVKGNIQKTSPRVNVRQTTERKEKNINEEDKEMERTKRERELEMDRLRKIEEEREREREREKDRMAVDRATLEARERAYTEAREKADRAAVERAMAEARERLEKACAEAREKSFTEKATMEAKLRAERAAIERATAEARERVVERVMAEKAAFGTRERMERSVSDKYSASFRNSEMKQSSSSLVYGAAYHAERSEGVEGESPQRCKARFERHQRTTERAAKALAEKNMRDLLAQREQAERNRLAETLDADVRRWSSGKEGNLRALLSTLQYILGPDCGWQPIPLTEVITAAAVKKAYRKATLCVHPDKLQQRGASIQQKYICEKVFDLLKEAWNKFNSEER
ncbi:auxilin-like protein 1 [Corylus avellana]|uniref:auxilin-like protein 1 n=1 Tax=Corylus avellana TaxID=13451 RepID=UPI00286D3C93|nr:auxilin-like protein 1 [Corylus avellana]